MGCIKQKGLSYQRILRDAYGVVQRATVGRDWSAVAPELAGQNLKLVVNNSGDFGTLQEYLVAERAFVTEAGETMDLYLEVDTARIESRTAATREIVSEARASFHAAPKLPYSHVIAQARFGKGTAIDKILRADEIKEVAGRDTILDSVVVCYCLSGDQYSSTSNYGFEVQPYFDHGKGNVRSAGFTFLIPSGLDPPERDGEAILKKDFVLRDTLGTPSYLGSVKSESGGTGSYFLTKKGEPDWPWIDDDAVKPAIAYGVGDLRTLPPRTLAIRVSSKEIYDDDLVTLARFNNIRWLDLGDCVGVTDKGLKNLAGLKRLQSLTLAGNRISGVGFSSLRDAAALTTLDVHTSGSLTDEGIAALGELKSLRLLTLFWASRLTDDEVAQLAKISALRKLCIWGSEKITDAGLRHISGLAKLESLTFSHAKEITARGVDQLTSLQNLQEISMGYMRLKDDAMLPLSRIPSLEYIELHGLDVTDAGIETLSNLPHPKRFYFEGCRAVTQAGIKNLTANLKGEFVLAIKNR